MKHLILGGSGFIGSVLSKSLIGTEHETYVVDRYISPELLDLKQLNKNLITIEIDILDIIQVKKILLKFLGNQDVTIWHLAANSNILKGVENLSIDYNDTLGTTCAAIEISRILKTKLLVFSSSSAVYGNAGDQLLAEDDTSFHPVSNYGVMKLSSEFLLKANNTNFKIPTQIFRFPNVVGWPTTHGVIFDLYNKLKISDKILEVLGDGFQTKPYIHVDDLVEIMIKLTAIRSDFEITNIAPNDSGISVREIAESLVKKLDLSTEIVYQNSQYGWLGDVPKYKFNVTKLYKLLGHLDLSSKKAIDTTLRNLI